MEHPAKNPFPFQFNRPEIVAQNADAEFNESNDENAILSQLDHLRHWQESQRQILLSSQLDQQRVLNWEKQKLYEMLGVNSTQEDIDSNDESLPEHEEAMQVQCKQRSPPASSPMLMELQSPSINQLNKIIANLATTIPHQPNIATENHVNAPKRPYLKRGEGLRNRFKISPDAYRLDKLPKYKYAPRLSKHAQTASQSRDKQRHKTDAKNDTKSLDNDAGEVMKSEGHRNIKRTQSLELGEAIQQNDEHRRSYSRRNVSELKLRPKLTGKVQASNNLGRDAIILGNIAEQGQNQIQLHRQEKKPFTLHSELQLATPIRNLVQSQQNEINATSSFVQLEQELDQSKATMDHQMYDANLAHHFKHGMNLSPQAIAEVDEEDEAEEQEIIEQPRRMSSGEDMKHVRFMANEYSIRENDDEHGDFELLSPDKEYFGTTSSPYTKSTESFQKFKEKLFDRKLKQKFKNRLSVAKDFELSDVFSTSKSYYDDDGASTTSSNDNPTNDCDQLKRNLHQRLMSLEKEIKSFREQNSELTKLIREHELIRLTFDQERMAEEERLHNEQATFEMYMNNEQMKLRAERIDWEKKAKESKSLNRSEKDELLRLREKCIKHDSELNEREQKHVAAQGRVRAQLRNAEKELKEMRFEVENLRRENKKLDTENIRLRRQCNNKLLSEINKNITKLAQTNNENDKENRADRTKHGVKQCSNKSAHKSIVARVTSTKEQSNSNMRSRSVPNLNEMDSCEQTMYDLCSPSASDAENSEQSHEDNPGEHSSYFPHKMAGRSRSHSQQYSEPNQSNTEHDNSLANASLKRIIENPDGSKDIWYPNGNLKKVSADGMCIRMLYFNKDIKETDIHEGIVKYYYAETNTWQTSYPDGLEIFEYPNGQIEHRFKNGTIEIQFPNRSIRITNPYRERDEGIVEEWKYADGSNVVQMKSGERILLLPNGQKEIHSNSHKRREYPDGTVKIVFPDGSQETRYSNGRVRLKNKEGKLIMDSETISI